MNYGVFFVLTPLGTFIWIVVLVNIGAAVEGSWETIVGYMDI
jgi:membrane protein DedA with SNARE-associated domain